ncbi:MAG: VOC family protein [Bacteroidota bacterium]
MTNHKKHIIGIQQIGIGVADANEAFRWYRKYFGLDIHVFEDDSEVKLMLPFTGGKIWKRHAILAMNLNGGAGIEIWQYKNRTPENSREEIQIGDYGIFCPRMKTNNVEKTFQNFKEAGINLISEIVKDPLNVKHFFLKDNYGNIFQVINETSWFGKSDYMFGGVSGCMIGVSDIEKAKKLYSNVLGYDKILYDKEEIFDDLNNLAGGKNKIRRVLLIHSKVRSGGFARLLGESKIELIQMLDKDGTSNPPKKIFNNRFWGDLGYIHLCFDVIGMNELKKECTDNGFPFCADSNKSFDMGEAAGHFSYIEDTDGTLIEFVETHKVPIIKKLGIYLNLKNRNPEKSLPDWMVRMMAMRRVKG